MRILGTRHQEVWSYLLSEQAQYLYGDYFSWLNEWIFRMSAPYGTRWELTATGWKFYVSRHLTARIRLTGAHPFSSRDLDAENVRGQVDREFPNKLKDFEDWMDNRGHRRARAQLAVARIIDPLLNPPESGFVERSWEELTPQERRKFITYGIEREKILLDRDPPIPRVQSIDGYSQSTGWIVRHSRGSVVCGSIRARELGRLGLRESSLMSRLRQATVPLGFGILDGQGAPAAEPPDRRLRWSIRSMAHLIHHD